MRANRVFIAALAVLLAATACRRQEQAVVGVAEHAVSAEQQASSAVATRAAEREKQRAELALIPLPTKSLYVDVRDQGAWANPFLSVDADMIDLRVTLADANPSQIGQGSMLRPEAARRQEIQVRPADLPEALIALPASAWRYGRVVAVAESPLAARKDQPAMRRHVEATIQQLNDLGIVVDEWPGR